MEHLQLIRRVLVLAVMLLVAAPAGALAADCTKTFVPDTGAWNVDGNWTPSGVPGNTDIVCVGPGTSSTVSANIIVAAVRSQRPLDINARLDLASADEPSTVTHVDLGPGDLGGAGSVTFDTAHFVQGAELYGSGIVRVTGSLVAENYLGIYDSKTLALDGLSTFKSHTVNMASGTTLTNDGAMTSEGGEFYGTNATVPLPVLHNTGSITLAGDNRTLSMSTRLLVDNDGTLAIADGTTGSRVYTDESSGESDGTFVGVTFTAAYSGPGFRLGPDATLTRPIVAGHVYYPHEGTLTVTDMLLSGGRLHADDTVVMDGDTDLYYGRVEAPVVQQPADGTAIWRASSGFTARRLEQAGAITITSTGANQVPILSRRLAWENTGTLTLRVPSGRFRTETGDEGARFFNYGTIIKDTTTSAHVFDTALINDGLIDIRAGGINAPDFQQTPDGTLRVDVHGAAQGTGFGYVASSAFRYSGRLESTLSGGFVPTPSQRFAVITGSRSGAFDTTALTGGMTVDETQPGSLGLVAPAARPDVLAPVELVMARSPAAAAARAREAHAAQRQARAFVRRQRAAHRRALRSARSRRPGTDPRAG